MVFLSPHIPEHQLIRGYPKLSGLMNERPEIAIYRRFGALSAQKILYLQAEITHLEQQLRKIEEDDYLRGKPYAVDWYDLSHSTNDEDALQWKLMQKICDKLEKYGKAHLCQRADYIARLMSSRDRAYQPAYHYEFQKAG